MYEGNFEQGKKEGYGVYTWMNGMFYAGNWKANQFVGYGTFSNLAQLGYSGEWFANKKHGEGVEIKELNEISPPICCYNMGKQIS